MTIAQNIIELRERFGLTQDELGEIAGVSGGAVSTWERGTAEPRMGAIQKMSDYFHITKSTLIEDAEPDAFYTEIQTAHMAEELKTRNELKTLFNAARNSSPEDIQFCIDFLERVSNKR